MSRGHQEKEEKKEKKEIEDHQVLLENKAHKVTKEYLELETFPYAHIRRCLSLSQFRNPIQRQHIQELIQSFRRKYVLY